MWVTCARYINRTVLCSMRVNLCGGRCSLLSLCSQDGGWKMGFPHSLQEVEGMLGFFGDEADI